MAELVADYFADGWRERSLACPCGNLLLIVSHPDLAQVQRAAAAGNAEAVAQLAIVEEALARFPPAAD